MRDYEVVYVFDAELDQPAVDAKLESFHEQLGAEVATLDHWGPRKLAYPVKKATTAYYVVSQVAADPEALPEFERLLKLDEQVLRYLVVLNEGQPTGGDSVVAVRPPKPGEEAEEASPEEAPPAPEEPEADAEPVRSGPPEFSGARGRRRRHEGPAILLLNYKDVTSLARFLTEEGKILPKRTTKVTARFQRQLGTAVKRARFLALLPLHPRPRSLRQTRHVRHRAHPNPPTDRTDPHGPGVGFGRWGLFLLAMTTVVFAPSVLIGIPFLFLAVSMPGAGCHGVGGSRAVLLLVTMMPVGLDGIWYLERGWAALVGGCFAALTWWWPAARFTWRGLAAIATAVLALVGFFVFNPETWSAVDWLIRAKVGGDVAAFVEILRSLTEIRPELLATFDQLVFHAGAAVPGKSWDCPRLPRSASPGGCMSASPTGDRTDWGPSVASCFQTAWSGS